MHAEAGGLVDRVSAELQQVCYLVRRQIGWEPLRLAGLEQFLQLLLA